MLAEGKSLRQVAKALHVALATLARALHPVPKSYPSSARVRARQVAGAGGLR